ncbi:hypothetical protein [Aurantiacibacter marinus]|uniref:Ferrochelatase n=1 Tax=Aurantiacibacter marinus TaxID=874156 RepID=A0A0H0XPR9_9SPHN|nr:hypothetical protein [Aurantiacibacter marinus]KLI64618.1 hypothetical protein AAV99_03425 [Aurantiacibacter marinus]
MKNVLASVAAVGLVFAPIAAQANTRAADAGVLIERAPAAMTGSSMLANEEDDRGNLYLLISLFVIAAGIAIAISGDASEGDDASPGTGG